METWEAGSVGRKRGGRTWSASTGWRGVREQALRAVTRGAQRVAQQAAEQ